MRATRTITTLLAATWLATTPMTTRAAGMQVVSTSFAEGGPIPTLHAASGPCDGQDVSPQVSWSDLPKAAKSVAVLMIDRDGGGADVVHWVAYDIPSPRGELRQGEGGKTDVGVVVGRNGTGTTVYRGMCPPAGEPPHRYVVTVIASDLPPDALPADLGRDELLQALKGHALQERSTVGRFGR